MNEINNSKLINPYSLLGVNDKSSLRDLKKNYYNMALICHPDRGGDKNDMNIICLAYNYIKEQLENVKEVTYEQLEDEFEMFCKEQESLSVPKFGNIYEETNDWIVDFNKEFETKNNIKNENIDCYETNPFSNGYGSIMDTDKVSESYKDNIPEKPKHRFVKDIVEYKEPEALPNSVTHYPLDKKPNDITDFSYYKENLSDYKIAFCDPEIKRNIIEIDYPKEDIEYQKIL